MYIILIKIIWIESNLLYKKRKDKKKRKEKEETKHEKVE